MTIYEVTKKDKKVIKLIKEIFQNLGKIQSIDKKIDIEIRRELEKPKKYAF